jgi:CRISPR-associated protein Cas2
MIVMLLEKVPLRLRGELTRWLVEPRSGIFVGHVNAMVRERLWEKCSKARGAGGVVQLWSTNNEQHFAMRMSGETSRQIVELEGLRLIQVPLEPGENVEEGECMPPDMDKKP